MTQKRLRIIAGPNGSGKSSIIGKLRQKITLGVYVNADDIEKQLSLGSGYELEIPMDLEDLQMYVSGSGICHHRKIDLAFVNFLQIDHNRLFLPQQLVNSYVAADIAAFIRLKCLEQNLSFSFETVLSHPSKLNLLQTAKQLGYRVYLYYISTETPDINIRRVEIRVLSNGHDVPFDRIKERYYRSMGLLYDVIKLSDRAYLFDNSGKESVFFAEITNGKDVEVTMPELLPEWFFKYVLKN